MSSSSLARERLNAALRSATLIVGVAILTFWSVCALFGRHITPLDPYADDLLSILGPPSTAHWFGTDQLGRDIFSRVITGARDILIVAPLATLLGTVLGTALGLCIGYFRGALDDIVGRVIEALQALPLVIVALMALAAVGTSNATVVLVIGFVFTPLIARTVRAAVLVETGLDYVARRAAPGRRCALHHVRRNPAQRPADRDRRDDGQTGLRHLLCRLVELHRLRHPAAVGRLGHRHRRKLQPDRQLLVDRPVRRGGNRLAGRRRQSGYGRAAERVRRMSSADRTKLEARDADALKIEHLEVVYRVGRHERRVLTDLDLKIRHGESYGLVGESGCGKSTVAFAAIRYLARNGRVSGGRILVDGRDLMALSPAELRRLRTQSVSMVYQDPGRALNPTIRIGRQMAEVFEVAQGLTAKAAGERVAQMLARVQISSPGRVMQNFPHELSGGMQQRVVIAMALSTNPALLILDEPTTGLDATVEAEVLDLVAQLHLEFNNSILFISHSLPVVARMCDRVGVLYAGELIEEGPAAQIFGDPRHPYTVGLLRCVPAYGRRKNHGRLETIPGFLPAPGSIAGRCVFAERCGNATDRCRREVPPPIDLGGRLTRCFYPELAPDLPHNAQETPAQPSRTRAAEPLLRLRQLSKTYQVAGKPLQAVSDVGLDLWAGGNAGVGG